MRQLNFSAPKFTDGRSQRFPLRNFMGEDAKEENIFVSGDSLTVEIKLLYLVQERISEKWSRPMADWSLTLQQLSILFGERVKSRLKV